MGHLCQSPLKEGLLTRVLQNTRLPQHYMGLRCCTLNPVCHYEAHIFVGLSGYGGSSITVMIAAWLDPYYWAGRQRGSARGAAGQRKHLEFPAGTDERTKGGRGGRNGCMAPRHEGKRIMTIAIASCKVEGHAAAVEAGSTSVSAAPPRPPLPGLTVFCGSS